MIRRAAGGLMLWSRTAAALGQKWRRDALRAWRLNEASAGESSCPEPALVPVPNKERGQALIEMALVLPIMLVFLMIIIDFGIALDRREVIQHAVREGARQAAVDSDCANVEMYITQQSQGLWKTPGDADKIDITYGDENGNTIPDAGESVEVSATFTYEFTIGGAELLGLWSVPVPTIDMTPSAQSRLEKSMPGTTGC